MNRLVRLLHGSLLSLAATVILAAPPAGYYDTAADKTGGTLRQALQDIISPHTVVPYSSSSTRLDTGDALKVLDEDPNNTNNVILIYSRRSEPKSTLGQTGGWNREHLWPNSYGLDGVTPAYSDLFNLRPEDSNVNSSRGNKYFDFSNTNDAGYRKPAHAEAPLATTDTDSWEPPDQVKGDIARALFYMDVRYDGGRTNELNLLLTESVGSITANTNLMGRLGTLLNWHRHDPVDAAEARRNDLIFDLYQHNRNPFIDHPEWIELIFGTNQPPLQLVVRQVEQRLQLLWDQGTTNALLEVSDNLAVWLPVSESPVTTNGLQMISFPFTNLSRYFRLRSP